MLVPLLMLAVMAIAFFFLVLRPAKARQAAAQKLVEEIQVGQRVMTTAGMFGYVRELTDDEVALEISPGVVIWMLKLAIAKLAETSELESSELEAAKIADITTSTIATDDVIVADAVVASPAQTSQPN